MYMKTTTSIFIVVALAILIGGYYFLNSSIDEAPEQAEETGQNVDPRNATYTIDGTQVTLTDGLSEQEVVPGSAEKTVTTYFGNEVRTDLNEDGREDIVFLLTQSTGGSGTFFYVVAALNTEDGWSGSQGFMLGDRIAPQTTEMSQNPNHKKVIVVNYVTHSVDQPLSERPSVGKSVWLKLDPTLMAFGEVEQNFEGEADVSTMTLDMKTWNWIKTTYNNDTDLIPKDTEDFSLTFENDGTFSANTDCNNMGGSYEVENNQIVFSKMATTLMYCDDSQEQEFSKMLGEIQSYFFTSKGELVFELKFDSGSSIFK